MPRRRSAAQAEVQEPARAKGHLLTVTVQDAGGHRLPKQRVKIRSESGVEVEMRTDDDGEALFPGLSPRTKWKIFVNGKDTGEVAEIERRDEEIEVEPEEEADDSEDEDESDSDEEDEEAFDEDAEI